MRFTHLRLENWRNFTSADVRLEGRGFLVGPNACGKSNLLDVFRFLHDIVAVGGGFHEAVLRRGGVSRIRCLAARSQPRIGIHVVAGTEETPDEWEYELRFSQDAQRIPRIQSERVRKSGEIKLERPDADDQADPQRLTQTYLEQVNVNREFRPLADTFKAVRYLHIVPHLVRDPDRSVGKKNDPFGGDFLEQVAQTNERTRNAWLRRIREALTFAVPQLKELELWRDNRGTPHLRGRYEHWRPQGAWQTESDFSDGTLRLIGLLWAVLDGTGPLLLEEPELSLHPEVVRHIPRMLARVQRRSGRQILLSTHACDLFRDDGIGLDEVLLLEPQAEGTVVKPADTIDEIKALLDGGLSLADAIMPHTSPSKAQQLMLFGE
ncbi:MAG: AAA family ATPase [Planctomycetes bacterium]|nr:AAA family ATPase [Planctomycetota bacterium]